MAPRRLSLIILAIAGWVFAGIQVLLLFVLLNRPFDDSISLAGRHTSELLALHVRNDQTGEVLAWLTQYHGEAPGHQVMITFVEWAINNAEPAEAPLARLQADPVTTERLAFAVTDGCQGNAFLAAVGQSASSAVNAVITQVDRLQSLTPSSGCE
jgi:hypothetical protein